MVRELFSSQEDLDKFLIVSCLESNIDDISWLAVNYPIRKISFIEKIKISISGVGSLRLNFCVKDGYIFKSLVKSNNEKTLVYLLEKLNQKHQLFTNKLYQELLEDCIESKNLNLLNYLLEINQNGIENKLLDRLVYLSCLNNNVSTLNYLIKKFNISPKSPSLRIAVYFGYLDIVHYLIQHNEDLLFKNPDIFDLAFEKNQIVILEYFLKDNKIFQMLRKSNYKNLAFILGVKSKNVQLLNYLILELDIKNKKNKEIEEFLSDYPSKEVNSILLHNNLNQNLKKLEVKCKQKDLTKAKI